MNESEFRVQYRGETGWHDEASFAPPRTRERAIRYARQMRSTWDAIVRVVDQAGAVVWEGQS